MSLGYRTVLFSPLVPDGSGVERVASGMAYRWKAVYVWDAGDESGGMETQWSEWLEINGTALTSDLPITPTNNGLDVEIQTRIGAASGKPETRTETVAVPAGSGTIDFYNTVGGDGEILVRLVRSSMVPVSVLLSSQEARLQAVELALASFPSGGASTLSAISDMSAFARTLNDDTTAGAARTTLGAGTSSLVIGTTTGTAADGALAAPKAAPTLTNTTLSGTVTVSTAGAIAQAAINGLTTDLAARVQVAGDLSGTAASPSVAKVKGITVSATAPTTGQVLTATSTSAAQWSSPTTGTVIDEIDDVPGLTAALTGKRATLAFEPGETFTIKKDTVTGFWPASWTSTKTPVYTGGSASAGVRPTSLATVTCIWKGAAPLPAVVTSGTAGALGGSDIGVIHG